MHTIKFYSLTAAFIAFSFITLAQGGSKIWLTIANPSNIPYTNASGELVSNDPALNNVISSLDISEVQRAIPTSRKAHLLNVYELTSYSADVVDMYTDLTNNVSVVSQVEYAPIYETMDGTDDYNTVLESPVFSLQNNQNHYQSNLRPQENFLHNLNLYYTFCKRYLFF